MPIVQISLLQGRTKEMKEELIEKVTDTIAGTLKISKDLVHIILYDVPRENAGHGGVPRSKVTP